MQKVNNSICIRFLRSQIVIKIEDPLHVANRDVISCGLLPVIGCSRTKCGMVVYTVLHVIETS